MAKTYDSIKWGRPQLALYNCCSTGCDKLADYWVSYRYLRGDGRNITVHKRAYGPHFRRWLDQHAPPAQLTLF
jgi:hypothetical protein